MNLTKKLALLVLPVLALSLAACGAAPSEAPAAQTSAVETSEVEVSSKITVESTADSTVESTLTSETIDVDLTEMSSTMVFSEVNQMCIVPQDYRGKRVKMQGMLATTQDEVTGKHFYAVIIQDATACCAQGLEFELKNQRPHEDYPPAETEVTVTGIFDTYDEDGYTYLYLKDAVADFEK